jgi:hypothetical protein
VAEQSKAGARPAPNADQVQTIGDRAALDYAITHGILYGNWCPQGRKPGVAVKKVTPEHWLE